MRILYLEDEAIIALDTADMLRDIGFDSIDMCHSLAMAETALQGGNPDIALLDVNLSHGRTSLDLGQRLIEAGIPVVFATGYSVSALPVDPRAHVVEKPVIREVLTRALSEASAEATR